MMSDTELVMAGRRRGKRQPRAFGGVALLLLVALALAALGQRHCQEAPAKRQRFIVTEALPAEQRCIATTGAWCSGFHAQTPIPWKPAPRGNKDCPGKCNGVGVCNYDTGYCDCPAGWTGVDCKTVLKRPCTHKTRRPDDLSDTPIGHIDAHGRDLNLTGADIPSTTSRCAGICDDDIAMCWCDGPMGYIPAPPGSPPGTPPVQRGRPMITPGSQPKTTADGTAIWWGNLPYDDLFGPAGWCTSNDTRVTLPCIIDGLDGRLCDQFRKKWRVLLDRADFEVLSPEFIDKAFSESNTTSGGLFGSGLEVQCVDSNIVEYKVYYRSNTVKTVKYRSWRTLFFQGTAKVHMFERMVIVYRRRPDEHIAYLEALHPKSTRS
ncbi:hypothetical protein FOA52_001022 [Chlamydomonas sp. UWO 241]|nr:hypothetical protein FOA52_001022 [Chlamydomonas sp. UWO 241]